MARVKRTLIDTPYISVCLGMANIFQTFDMASVKEALEVNGKSTLRYRDFPLEVGVYFVIAMTLYMNVSLREVLFSLVEGLRMVRSLPLKVVAKSAISQARTRIGSAPLQYLYEKKVKPVSIQSSKGSWFKDHLLVSIDGSTLDLPDEQKNYDTFGGPSTADNKKGPFPQIKFACLAEIGTHVLFAGRMAGYKTSEKALAKDILPQLHSNMLCMADRGFYSYDLWKCGLNTGADLLWRAPGTLNLPVDDILSDGSYISFVRSKNKRNKPSKVRVVEYRVDGVEADKEEIYRLITTITDPEYASADDLAQLYHQRWEIETAFDELKTHLRGSRMCLRSKTPELVKQEFYGLMLAHYTVRKLMHEASLKAGVDPDVLSFTHSLRVVRRKLPIISSFSP